MKPKPTRSWGSIYRNALRRGYDHGYAGFLADGWEKRQKKTKITSDKQTSRDP